MVLHTTCLREFVTPVPTCLGTVRLEAALTALGQPAARSTAKPFSERLVLVDEHQQAIGWVSIQQLLYQLIAFKQDTQAPDESPLTSAQKPDAAGASLLEIVPSIVEPLIVLSGDLSIDQFLPHLHAQPHACYGLTGAGGAFLGLLDSTRLLHFLTAQAASTVAPPIAAVSGKADVTQRHTASLSPLLLKLLEQLPLPVMLQTRDGRVLLQSAIWRTQIGALLDPSFLRQEVAALLELPATAGAAVTPQPNHEQTSHWERSTTETATAYPARSPAPATTPQPWVDVTVSAGVPAQTASEQTPTNEAFKAGSPGASLCHLGSKPGTCICVCSLKGGQEQVWQFVKIPIGDLSSPVEAGVAGGDRTLSTTVAEMAFGAEAAGSPFRLATLVDALPATPSPVEQRSINATIEALPLPTAIGQMALEKEAIDASEELWLVLAQDITEQQQLARELTAKNADLIQLNRLKDEFLSCISHELRTPLTAVLGLSSLLKDQTLGALNPRQVHYAQLIYQSGRQLMAVVNDILDLTRIETGQLELMPEPVDLSVVCQRAFEQAQQLRLQESNQDVSDLPADQPPFALDLEPGMGLLIADEQRLRQMLVHLLSNALKFTELNGSIGLKVGHWGGWIAFTVWDTGIGIPAEKQHLIFQKFQQLENPLTRRFEGTGLGLVLTQRLARLHGGDVTFISKDGQGSQFTILLPPTPPDAIAALHSSTQGNAIDEAVAVARSPIATVNYELETFEAERNQLVLIVEAVPHFIEVLSDQLSDLGYRVAVARSGTEALEKARRLQPCVLFLNPVLPLLSGWDVLTLLKTDAETQQIPVVVVATQVDEEQAHQRQADHLLSLPIQPRALQKCLHQLVMKPQVAKLKQRNAGGLTVLRLTPGIWSNHYQPIPTADLNALLHSRQYRVLEADDLEQAELLARVWKPNVVLLDGILVDAVAYFEQYSRQIFLASLPLVTIDQATTQAANQIPGLLVFPCLSTPGAQLPDSPDETFALLQVIQVAAGYAWRPSILAFDATALPLSSHAESLQSSPDSIFDRSPQENEWLQALVQYLNTAGLRGMVGRGWQEVFQQVESRSVDVLLLAWTETTPQSFTLSMLHNLQQLQKRSPILVLDHRQHNATADAGAIAPLPTPLQQIATQILPASLPMADLLNQIHCFLK